MKMRIPEWRKDAACLDEPIIYFESKQPLAQVDALLEFCARCPVRPECEAEALATDDFKWLVRGNRIRSKAQQVKPWVDPLYDSCGTYAGPGNHRREKEANCTVCGLVEMQIKREARLYKARKSRNER